MKVKLFVIALLFGFVIGDRSPVAAQEDFDEMFEQMMKEFFPRDLIDEIESIREKESSPRKGKSFFRDDPRFLEIKERQLRNRKKDDLEKQHPDNLKVFRPIAKDISKSVVGVYSTDEPKKRLAYATVVSRDGLLITKASELDGSDSVRCVDQDGMSFTAKVIKKEDSHDLALLKTDRNLQPIKLEATPMDEGTILVSVKNSENPVAMGTLAVKPRSIIGKNRGFLGVEPGPSSRGVLIKSVTPRSAASRAGMADGDIVTSINGNNTRTVPDLVREIGSKKKGDTIVLIVQRGNRTVNIRATLDGQMIGGERAARFEMMRRLGTLLSKRRDEFPSVFQHDSPILPNECGGPLVDLDGKVIGINIARAGRTSTFALPMKVVQQFVESANTKTVKL